MRLSGFIVILAIATIAAGPAYARDRLDPGFEKLVDRYLAEIRGVGVEREPDTMSAESFAARVEKSRELLTELEAIDRVKLAFVQDIDWRFMKSLLEANIIEGEDVQRWRQDPRTYLNNRAVAYRVFADPRPVDTRAAELIDELGLLEIRLQNAEQNLDQHIPRWVELSNVFIDGFLVVLEVEVPAFADRISDDALKRQLLAANQRGVAALNEYRRFINEELPERPDGDYAIGAEAFNALMEKKYLLPDDSIHLRRIARGQPGFNRVPEYHDWGWKQFNIVLRHLEVKAKKIDPERTWLEIIKDEKQDHFFAEQLVYKHLEASRASRQWVIDNDLVTIPWDDDDGIMEAADPSLWASQWWGWGPSVPNDSEYRKAAWTVIPISPDWPDDVAEANLTEKDASFMYVIATHEVYPGHLLQRLYQNTLDRPLRVWESSYSNQAWCYYIEWELTPDPKYGWYPEDKQDIYELEYLRAKLWRMGRVIIDSGLHTGRMSYDEALDLESNTIGFVRRGAQINIDGITSRVGTTMSAPTVGYFQWMLLREDYFQKMRELDQKGSLKDFHDRVYKIGFLPIVLVREEMFHDLEEEFGKR
ncbi:MAG: DUF885 family protein [Pseudomonadota bacterium]